MNDAKVIHASDIKSLPEAVFVELQGTLFPSLAREPNIGNHSASKYWTIKAMLHWHANPASRHMLAARLHANLHAQMRFSARKFKQGDLADFITAANAMPYCDALFTDRAFANLSKEAIDDRVNLPLATVVAGFSSYTQHLKLMQAPLN